MIKGVVFDFGGVITRYPVPEDYEPALSRCGLTWNALMKGFTAHRAGFDHDEYDGAEMYRRILTDNQLPFDNALLAELAVLDSKSWTHANPATYALMKQLKADGKKVGILTNMSSDFAENYFFPCFGEHLALADAVVVSSAVGVIKPDPKIYAIMCERIGLAPSELLFTDDLEGNCDGARACGWNAVRFTTADEVAKFAKNPVF